VAQGIAPEFKPQHCKNKKKKKEKNLFLTVLETRKSSIKVSASGEGFLSV
jgi:hypothetical protein